MTAQGWHSFSRRGVGAQPATNERRGMNKVTLTVPDEIIRKAKARAALEGRSLSDVVRVYLKLWTQDVKESDTKTWTIGIQDD